MAIDFGAFNKRVLLIGAGFSRNWGGRLAGKVWEDVFGHPAVKARPVVIELLRKEPSFEAALEIVRTDGRYSREDLAAMEEAIATCFQGMDRQFRDPNYPVATATINDFISRFCPGPVGQATGYVFSLNQDLLLERIYGTQVDRQKLVYYPGTRWLDRPPPFPAGLQDIPDASLVDPAADTPLLRRCFNLIKLHGSMNWRAADGSRSMIIGGGKPESIARVPLLLWYQNVFDAVLCAGAVRLMVIGYGWGDEHINAIVAKAARDYGLQVYVWDTNDPRVTLPKAPHGDLILNALMGKASRLLAEVMPVPMNPRTPEYDRIVREFF